MTVSLLRRRPSIGLPALVLVIMGCSIWSAGYALEFAVPSMEAKMFWAKIQYIGIIAVPIGWYSFSMLRTGAMGWLDRIPKISLLLWVIPVVTLGLVWTNEYHHLIWTQAGLLEVSSFDILRLEHGYWFWIFWIYSYCLLLLALVKVVGGFFAAFRHHRWQIRLLLIASLIPWFGNLIYVTGLNPIPYLDWTPFAFMVSGALITISLMRFRLVDILPIARQTVFADQIDSLLVLDLQDCVVDLNHTARKMVGAQDDEVLSKPIGEVLPELTPWIELAHQDGEVRDEVSLGEGNEQRYYDLHISPLKSLSRFTIGRLIVMHDITQHIEDQARLEQIRLQLEELVSKRTEELRKTVQRLEYELSQRTLAEIRFEEVIEAAPDAIVVVDQDGIIMIINEQAERLTGYTREELLGSDVIMLAAKEGRGEGYEEFRNYIASPFTREIDVSVGMTVLRKDGIEVPIEGNFGPLRTEHGYWVACIARDVSQRMEVEREQKKLMEELRQSRKRLQALTFRLQEVRESERSQIATELHDGVGQILTGLNLNLKLIQNLCSGNSSAEVRDRLEDSSMMVEATIRQLRDVMTYLHPPVLDEYGLVSTLKWYSSSFSQRTGIVTNVVGDEFKPRLPQKIEIVIFRIVQEALNNVAKHAQAKNVSISIEEGKDEARVIIVDDGIGFDPAEVREVKGQPHWGILLMEQRAASIEGTMTIDSAPNSGTRLVVSVRR